MIRNAIITGATGGLGNAFAQQLAAKGCALILSARNEEKLQSLQQNIVKAHGVEVHVFPSDLSRPAAASALFEQINAAGLQAVYSATKAYVLSFSQALAEELRDSGMKVTALCPGPIQTGFVSEEGLEGVKAFENAASPDSVASCGIQTMEKGKLVAINDRKLSIFLKSILPFIPRKTMMKISRQAMEKST